MRNIFIKNLVKEAEKNINIYLLTGDLGYRSFEIFSSKFPDRFINCGVAENNMVGISAGLALIGKKVFVYSIAPFVVFRSLEQIRNIICHNDLDVKIIGGGGGFSYGEQGISHNPTEDFAVMKSLPKIKVFSPGTEHETTKSIKYMFKDNGPCYIRLGKVPTINFKVNDDFYLGQGTTVRDGTKVLLLSTGNIISEVIKAADYLEKKNITTKVISFFCIKPLDKKYIMQSLNNYKYVFSIEEHGIIGGFGSSIDEILNDIHNPLVTFKKIGLDNEIHKDIGSQDYLRKIKNIDATGIIKFVLNNIK